MILDGATCRLRQLGDVRDVLGFLGVALVVPIVLRVLEWFTIVLNFFVSDVINILGKTFW